MATNGVTSRPKVALLGAGRLATWVARILSAAGAPIRAWARSPEARARFAEAAPKVEVVEDVGQACAGAELVFLAVPGAAVGSVANLYGPYALPDHVVLHASRGVGPGFALPHQLIRRSTCVRKIGVLGGPLYGTDLSNGRPLAAVLASRFSETGRVLSRLLAGTPVILHETRDVVGVEIAGAFSNVAAIAAGMSDALDLGETARGVLLTRGLVEARRLGVALGADAATFTGLAGVGDLIPRKVSSTDRNRALGGDLAAGVPLAEALARQTGEVEGVLTAAEAVGQAAELRLELPLARAVDRVAKGELAAKEALEAVLRLDLDLDSRGARA